jgi:diguanylate cyclase (GGDEF)-like protein
MQIDRRSGVRAVLPRMLIKFSATILVVMALGGYYTYSQVSEKLLNIEQDNIQAVTDGTVAGISDMIITRDYTHLQETLRQSMDNPAITGLAVTNLQGKVLSEMVRVGRVPEPQFKDTPLTVPTDNSTRSIITRDGTTVTVWQRVDAMVHLGWIRLTLSTVHYDSIMSGLIQNIMITIAAMLAIIILVIVWQYIKSYRQLSFYEANLMDAAHTDSLTGLANRLMLNYYLNRSVTRAMTSKNSFSVAFLDLDGFKSVNDTYGHRAGDELLIQVANRLRKTLRGDDQIIRLGGDEFVLILNEVDHNITEMLLSRVLKSIELPYSLSDNSTVHISTSIGVSEFGGRLLDSHSMLNDADTAMYRAKQSGKGKIVYDKHE